MKRVVVVGLAAIIVIGLGFWLWSALFPTPQKVIRSRLNALAKTISFESGSGMLSKTYSAQKAADFFTTNVEVELNLTGYETVTLHGRDEVLQIAVASRSRLTALKVEFPDMNITVAPDGQTAKVNLTAKATMPGERDISAQEFDFDLKKVNGKWLIDRVETVKTLSSAATVQLAVWGGRPHAPGPQFGAPRTERLWRTQALNGETFSRATASREGSTHNDRGRRAPLSNRDIASSRTGEAPLQFRCQT